MLVDAVKYFLCVTKYFCPYLICLGDGLPALWDPGDEGGGGGRGEVLPRLADELRHGDDPRHRAVSSLLALTKYFYALRKKYFLCVSLSTAAAATRSTVHVASPAVSAPLTLHTPHSLRAAALAPPPRRAGHSRTLVCWPIVNISPAPCFCSLLTSALKRSIRRFVITEKAPTRAFS